MKLELIDHWWVVLRKAWSSIFAIISTGLGALDIVLSFFSRFQWFTASHTLTVAATVFAGLSAAARVIVQWKLREELKQRDEDAYGYGQSSADYYERQ